MIRSDTFRVRQGAFTCSNTGFIDWGALLVMTALVYACVLGEGVGTLLVDEAGAQARGVPRGMAVISASLPAIGAAVYGICMHCVPPARPNTMRL
jgi:hypothetical protein